MCSKLEDCLLTRIGFRIFLITIISIILAAIAFNVRWAKRGMKKNTLTLRRAAAGICLKNELLKMHWLFHSLLLALLCNVIGNMNYCNICFLSILLFQFCWNLLKYCCWWEQRVFAHCNWTSEQYWFDTTIKYQLFQLQVPRYRRWTRGQTRGARVEDRKSQCLAVDTLAWQVTRTLYQTLLGHDPGVIDGFMSSSGPVARTWINRYFSTVWWKYLSH